MLIRARLLFANSGQADVAAIQLASSSAAALSTALGVTVVSASAPTITVEQVHAPSPPPPSPSMPPNPLPPLSPPSPSMPPLSPPLPSTPPRPPSSPARADPPPSLPILLGGSGALTSDSDADVVIFVPTFDMVPGALLGFLAGNAAAVAILVLCLIFPMTSHGRVEFRKAPSRRETVASPKPPKVSLGKVPERKAPADPAEEDEYDDPTLNPDAVVLDEDDAPFLNPDVGLPITIGTNVTDIKETSTAGDGSATTASSRRHRPAEAPRRVPVRSLTCAAVTVLATAVSFMVVMLTRIATHSNSPFDYAASAGGIMGVVLVPMVACVYLKFIRRLRTAKRGRIQIRKLPPKAGARSSPKRTIEAACGKDHKELVKVVAEKFTAEQAVCHMSKRLSTVLIQPMTPESRQASLSPDEQRNVDANKRRMSVHRSSSGKLDIDARPISRSSNDSSPRPVIQMQERIEGNLARIRRSGSPTRSPGPRRMEAPGMQRSSSRANLEARLALAVAPAGALSPRGSGDEPSIFEPAAVPAKSSLSRTSSEIRLSSAGLPPIDPDSNDERITRDHAEAKAANSDDKTCKDGSLDERRETRDASISTSSSDSEMRLASARPPVDDISRAPCESSDKRASPGDVYELNYEATASDHERSGKDSLSTSSSESAISTATQGAAPLTRHAAELANVARLPPDSPLRAQIMSSETALESTTLARSHSSRTRLAAEQAIVARLPPDSPLREQIMSRSIPEPNTTKSYFA